MMSDLPSCPSCGAGLTAGATSHSLCVSCLLKPEVHPPDEHLQAGARLGPYEIGPVLGRGGMGEVYRGWDTRLLRHVAIKLLPAPVADDRRLTRRLEREARIVASLNHPHICAVHDIGHEHGLTYVVMEHLDGETLAERLVH